MNELKRVTIYTDGACSGNPGPGGWAAILSYEDVQLEISGYEAHTTNNRMELTGPIEALARLKGRCEVAVYSDSSYLVNAFTKGWLANWQRNNWLKSDKKPVENQDLWLKLLVLCEKHVVKWVKVRGHADNASNNRCDQLAREAIRVGRQKDQRLEALFAVETAGGYLPYRTRAGNGPRGARS